MALFNLVKDTLEEKVKSKIIYDAQKQKKKDQKSKAEKKAQDMLNKFKWKAVKAQYEAERDAVIPKIAKRMIKTWEDWNKKNYELTEALAEEKVFTEEKKKLTDQETKDIDEIIAGFMPTIQNYITQALELNPKFGKKIKVDNEVNYIKTQANDQYVEMTKVQKMIAKKIAKAALLQQKMQYKIDEQLQALSNIPLKMEEKIDQAKTLLDTLLGKIPMPALDPNTPDFDINAIIAQIKAFLNPVISTTMPLTAVVGKIPVLGDIIGLMTMLQAGSGSSSSVSKEELEKILKKGLPTLDGKILDKISAIKDDVIMFCMTLPTLLVQIIFNMINVIYSKLKIITSIIPLGGFFPLSLVPAAITATPKILALIKTLPGLLYDMIVGIIKQKIAEAMALAKPGPPQIPRDALYALANNIQAKKKVAKKKKTYNEISREFYVNNNLSSYGYTLAQVKTMQKNYLHIFNGKDDLPPAMITIFKDNGKDQNLPSMGMLNSFWDAGAAMANAVGIDATGAPEQDESQMEPGFDEEIDSIARKKATPEDYEAFLNARLGESSDLSSCLYYWKLVPTEKVVGEWYPTYKDQVSKKYKEDVVFKKEFKPLLLQNKSALDALFGG